MTVRSFWISARLAVFSLIVSSVMLLGQTTFGLIEGRVTDATGAVLPGAAATVTNIGTGDKRVVLTNEQGLYRVLNLKPGDYEIRVDRAQFRSAIRQGVRLDVSQTVDIPFQLELPTATQTATATAEAPLVNTQTGEIGQVIEPRRVVDLPVNGRDFTRLALFAPGAKISTSMVADLVFGGTDSSQNYILLDGTDATWVDNNYLANGLQRGARLTTASSESVEEFRVLTSNYSAEYGRAAGAVISVITKSGTNMFHGSGYYFLRNQNLDAKNFFDPATKPLFHLNQFGGSLGGPIRRNRLFFFSNYEGSRQNVGGTQTGTVPSVAFRATVAPALANILAILPLPTQATADPNVGLARVTGQTAITENLYSTRIDFKATDNDSVFGRFNIQDSFVDGPLFMQSNFSFGSQKQIVPCIYGTGTVSYVHTFRPNLMNEAKLGIDRQHREQGQTSPDFATLAALQTPAGHLFTGVTITGVDIKIGPSLSYAVALGYEFIDNVTWYSGRHSVKAGINVHRKRSHSLSEGFPKITYKSLADFAANKIQNATIAGDAGPGTNIGWEYGAYVEDSIKLQRRLTVNIGLRYDYITAYMPTSDTKEANFDLTTLSLVTQAPFYTTPRTAFAPRVGVVYDLLGTGRTVLGGGYGIYYQPYALQDYVGMVLANVTPSTTMTQTTNPGLSYPLMSLTGGTSAPPNENAIDPNLRLNHTQQFTANLQQRLGSDMSVQAAYVGSRSSNDQQLKPGNLIDPATGKRPYPQFSVFTTETWNGHGQYDALEILFNRRLSRGLSFNTTYTYSRNWDNKSLKGPEVPCANDRDFASCPGLENGEWGPADFETPQNLSVNASWQLPLGRGRWLEGWQWNGIVLARSGLPYTVALGTTEAGTGWLTNQRPDLVAGVPTTGNIQGPTGWLNPAAFSIPAAGQYGDLGRNSARGPNLVQSDMSLFKNIRIRESHRVQLRAEVFNILNHPIWSASPALTLLTPASFGHILSTFGRTESFGTSRQIQLAVRYDF